MRKKLIARTAKLLTESKRGHKGKGVAITYEHIPKDLDERNHGSIYAVINITTPSHEAEEVTELIIDAFHGEYYQDLSRDPLTSFEAALSKVNEELGEITHQGNINWLKNLNAILAVLSDSTLHVTKAGKTEAYLYRGSKSSHVSEGLGGDTVNPLRTFINIASGEMAEGDKVAIITPGVLFHLSKDELQSYVQEFQPRVAISHLADLLEGTSNEVSPNAILILEAITPEGASNETIEEQPDEVWISEPNKPVQNAVDASAPFLKKIWLVLAASWLGLVALTQDKVIPVLSASYGGWADMIGDFRNPNKPPKRPKEKILVETDESLSIIDKRAENFEDLKVNESEDPLANMPKKSTGQEIYIKESQQKPKWLKLEKVNFSFAQKFGNNLNKASKKLLRNRKNILVVTVLLVLVLGGSIFVVWKNKNNNEDVKLARASLTEAQSKYEVGQNALAGGENKSAADSLNQAQSIAEGLIKNKTVGDDASTLLEKIKAALNKAEGVVLVNPAVFADTKNIAGNNSFGPYLIGTSLYLINKDNGSIASVSTKSGEVSSSLDSPKISGKILAATAVTRRDVLVFITDQGNIYEFDTVDNKVTEQDTSGDIEKPVAMTSFSTNIYTLDSVNGKVYKRLKTSTGYGRRTEYITDSSDVKDSASIATDSSIYALLNNGSLVKYLAGKKQDFGLNNMPFSLTKPGTVFALEDLKNIYITDPQGKRIVVFDDTGRFVNQLVSDKFNNIAGVYVIDKTGYVNAEGKLYKISF
jgi:hypothetical protein